MPNLAKIRLILIASLATVGIYGCVQPQQVEVLERDQRRLQAENTALQKELGSVRVSLADSGANMQQLQQEFNSLKGRIEETRHQVGQEIDQTSRQGDKRVKDLEIRLAKLAEGLQTQEAESKELREWMQQLSTLASAGAVPTAPTELGSGESEAVSRDYEVAWRGLEKKDYRFAIARFKDFLKKYPKSKLAGSAQYRVGESHYALREFEQAIIEFDAVRTRYPQEEKAASSLLRQAFAFAELGENSNARVLLQELTEKFAQTPEAVQAKLRLKSLPS